MIESIEPKSLIPRARFSLIRLGGLRECQRRTAPLEKLFSWKVLVAFCALFIVTWILLQTVQNMRLENEAQMIGDRIFSWSWPDQNWNWQSRGEITEASILRKSDNDAVIKVTGKQIITELQPGQTLDNSSGRSETVDCSATLTLYRKSNKWVLGRVEL